MGDQTPDCIKTSAISGNTRGAIVTSEPKNLVRLIRVILVLFIVAVPLSAYVPRRISTSSGLVYERWAGTAFPISWQLNTTRGSNIQGSRNLVDVVRQAFQAWSSVTTSRVAFAEGANTGLTNAAQDGINLVSFVPAVFNADAPSLTILYTVSSATSNQFPGQIREADVLFNPQSLLSLDDNVPSDRFDIEALVLHEIGHLLGLDHSGLFSAVMFPALTRGNTLRRSLSTDDILGISNLYPTPDFFATRGSISGSVRAASGVVTAGAHVIVADESGKPVVSTLSESDGSYFVRGLQAGNYSAYAEPFDEPSGLANPPFTTRFAVTSGSPLTLTLNKSGGDNQTGTAGQALAQQLEVTVVNSGGAPVGGTLVRFAATSGGGSVIPVQAATDAQGKARTTAYLGKAGTQTFVASAGAAAATFFANATAAAVSSITFVDLPTNTPLGELTVNEGNTLQTQLRILDGTGSVRTDVPVSYSSLSPDIATIDSAGLIRGVKAGFSTLTVAAGGAVATATITVVQVNAGAVGEVSSVAIDNSKRLYLAAPLNHTILTAASLAATPEVYAGIHQSPGLKDDVRLQSQFRNPSFIAVDPIDSTVYVSDSANNVIRRIKPGTGGRVETLAAGTTFNNPQGIALDNAGYLWVVDSGSHTIRRINLTTQAVETIAGLAGSTGSQDGTGSQARFNSPAGIAFEPESIPQQLERFRTGGSAPPISVLVADTVNGTIRRVKATGEVQTIAAASASALALEEDGKSPVSALTGAAFNSPTGVAVDPFGNIYFSEAVTGQIKLILRNGRVVAAAQPNTIVGPKGLVINEFGRLLVADRSRSAREIINGKPEITSVSPQLTGGARVTIKGKSFAPETVVLANNVVVIDATVQDSETIVLTVPQLTPPINISVANRGGSQDVTPPQLLAFDFAPKTIDTRTSSSDVAVNFSIIDDLSGASSLYMQFASPSGNQRLELSKPLNSRRQITDSITATFPQFGESGTWKVLQVFLRDAVNNGLSLGTSDLAALGFPTQLNVVSTPDTTPPSLAAFDFTPKTIDTTSGPATVTVSFSVTDDLSKATYLYMQFQSPSGNQRVELSKGLTPGLTLSDSLSATFPQFIEAGTWRVLQVNLRDTAGNIRILTTAELQSLGFTTQLNVTSTPDLTPPRLTAFDFTPKVIDTSVSPGNVTINFSVSDDVSKAAYLYMQFASPSGNQRLELSKALTGPGPVINDSITATFPQFSEIGRWRVLQVFARDGAGNSGSISTTEMEALQFPTDLYVADPATRPVISSVSNTSGAQGTTVAAIINGSNLAGATSVTFSGTGVTATIATGATATSLPITITIAAGAQTGLRTITVQTATNVSTALSGFTVTAPNP